ncbi:MAG: ferric reductase-like transmembrane domain-containing protein [Chloroflexota bacterium]
MNTKRVAQGIFWLIVYLLLTLAPLFVLKIGPVPEGRGFWREFSVALGFCGLAMVMLQFILTARFRRIKYPYGSDIVYYFHRQISQVAFALILAHPIILFIVKPDTLQLLNLLQAPWRARFGVTGLVVLFLLVSLSVFRKKLKFHYDEWRITHGIFAVAAVALAMAHIIGVGYYISTPLKQFLWGGYGVFWMGLLLYVRVIKPWMEYRRPYEVANVKAERGDAWTVTLHPVGHGGFRFQPGQFAWLTLRSSPFADKEHPFSISSSSEQTGSIAFTIKNLGDFTATVKDIQAGELAYLDGPHGGFSIDRHPHAPGFVFIAGGIGITPMMSMLHSMADRGDQRPAILLYGSNTWDAITFREELDDLAQHMNLKLVHILAKPPEGWSGERGFITLDVIKRHLPPASARYEHFICGPDPMMNAVEKALRAHEVDWGDFHSERFDLV